jgi:hypothetical protein
MTKRTISTDALETLGTIIGPDEKRDAIHLAVLPAIAHCDLSPGDSISITDGAAHLDCDGLAIVDPFLPATVLEGEHFWAILKPRLVTSLRHVWTHPDFADEGHDANAEKQSLDIRRNALQESRSRIEEFARTLGVEYQEMIDAAEFYLITGYTTNLGDNERYKEYFGEFTEFWWHYEVLTGDSPKHDGNFFDCSC